MAFILERKSKYVIEPLLFVDQNDYLSIVHLNLRSKMPTVSKNYRNWIHCQNRVLLTYCSLKRQEIRDPFCNETLNQKVK